MLTHPQFLLPLRRHEALLSLLASGLSLQPGADLRLLPVNLGLLPGVESRDAVWIQ